MENGDQKALEKKERIRKFGEVFTPPETVKAMCDMLEKENPDAFLPWKTFLEPTCGDGAFVLEILRRKFARCRCRLDYSISLESLYAMEIQADNVKATIENVKALCREYITPTKAEEKIIEDHVIQADSLKIIKMMNNMNERNGENDNH